MNIRAEKDVPRTRYTTILVITYPGTWEFFNTECTQQTPRPLVRGSSSILNVRNNLLDRVLALLRIVYGNHLYFTWDTVYQVLPSVSYCL